MANSIKRLLLPEDYERDTDGLSWTTKERYTYLTPPTSLNFVELDSGYEIGDQNPDATGSIIDSIDIEAEDTLNFIVTVNYIPRQVSAVNSGNLQTGQVEVQFNTWYSTKVVEYDTVDSSPIANSAGDAPNPLPVRQVPNDEIVIVRRESSFNLSRTQDKGKINSSAFTLVGVSIPQYCAMLSDYSFTVIYDEDNNVDGYNVRYAFQTNYKKNFSGAIIGFKLELLDAGFNKLTTANDQDTSTPILSNKSKIAPATAVKLDGSGQVLTGANPTPVYYEKVADDVVNFTGYGLPTSWPY